MNSLEYYKRLLIIKNFNEFIYNFFIKKFLDKYNVISLV